MKKSIKKNCIFALALTSIACAASAGVAWNSVTVSASESATLPTTTAFNVSTVQIRMSQVGETTETSTGGIRFVTRVEKGAYESLGEVTEVGTLLFPAAANFTEEEMTVDSPAALKIVCEGEYNGEVRDGKFTVVDGETTYYEYRAYLYQINAANYYDGLDARSYVVVDGVTYYTGVVEKSVGSVATELLRDTKTEQVDEYQYEVSEGVYSPYPEAFRNELQTYVFADDTAFGAPTVDEITYAQKVHYGETVKIPAFTATDCLGEEATVAVTVKNNGEVIDVTDGKFTVESYDAYTYEVTATDLEGRTTVNTYTVGVYEENFACSFIDRNESYQFITTCGDVEIGGNMVHALGIQGKKQYNYANVAFAQQVDWANKYVSFKVYNPSAYTATFQIWATKEAKSYTTTQWAGQYVLLQEVSLAAGETQEIALDDWYDFESYPYLSIYMPAGSNGGGTNANTDASTNQFCNTKFYIYDCVINEAERVDPTSTVDYRYSTTTATNGFTVLTNTDTKYIKEGLYSLGLKFGGTWPTAQGIDAMKDEELSNMESVSFSVYNATTVDVPLAFSFAGTSNTKVVSTTAGTWTDVTVPVSAWLIADGDYLTIYSNADYWKSLDGNATSLNTAVFADYFYFDNFQFVKKAEGVTVDATSEDYLWAKGTVTAQAYTHVNTNTAYCVEGSSYSWAIQTSANYPNVKNEYSATIDWSKYSSLSFSVYNPTKYTIRYTIYLMAADGTTTLASKALDINAGWNEYTFDVSTATARTTGCYIRLYTGWSSGTMATIDGTKWTTAYNPLWYAMKTQGIYLDGFKLA